MAYKPPLVKINMQLREITSAQNDFEYDRPRSVSLPNL